MTLLDDRTFAHNDHFVAKVGDNVEIMTDQDDRKAGIPSDLVDKFENLSLHRHVQCAGRLVQNENGGMCGDGARNRSPLAL
ncbi:MAG: hypothetical protein ABJA11_07550, partial [Pseudolysinimonas sp.]